MQKAEKEELEYLRFFYSNVQDALGPGDGDVRLWIQEQYEKETGDRVPDGYREIHDDEDEE